MNVKARCDVTFLRDKWVEISQNTKYHYGALSHFPDKNLFQYCMKELLVHWLCIILICFIKPVFLGS